MGASDDSRVLQVSRVNTGNAADSQYNFGITGPFRLFNLSSAVFTTSISQVMVVVNDTSGTGYDGAYLHRQSISARDNKEVTDAVRFLFDSGNIASGEIVMYGIANA